jgi:hypothetical protein
MFIIIRANAIDIAQISKRKVGALSISILIMCLFMTIWLIVVRFSSDLCKYEYVFI